MSDLILAGDLYVADGSAPSVDQGVRVVLASARHSLVNLEGPATRQSHRIPKTGPHLTMLPEALDHVRDVGFTGVCLANNHILDAGVAGVGDTLRAAHERGLDTVGAATSAHGAGAAARLRLPLDAGFVTVLNFCENEWSVRPDGSGASGWNVVSAHRAVQAARQDGDRVVVVLHGGNEYLPLPRPRLREELRFLAENGADAVAVHHAHVVAAYEVWHDVPIFYGLGNFQFTLRSPHTGWYEGLMIGLTFPEGEPASFDVEPIRQTPAWDVALADGENRLAALRELEGYRIQVQSDEALAARWAEFAEATGSLAAQAVAPTSWIRPRALRRLAEKGVDHAFRRDKAAQMAALNFIRCESLRDALTTSLQAGLR